MSWVNIIIRAFVANFNIICHECTNKFDKTLPYSFKCFIKSKRYNLSEKIFSKKAARENSCGF